MDYACKINAPSVQYLKTPVTLGKFRGVAQLAERLIWDQEVVGSSPVTSTSLNKTNKTKEIIMFLFIFGIIILIAGIGTSIYLFSDRETGWGAGVLIGSILLAVLLIVLSCLVSVPTGHTGVVTTFGKVEDKTLDSGIHGKAPWNKVVELDNRVQKSTVELYCFSSDIQEVTVMYTLNYQISKSSAQDIYRTVGKDYYATVITPNISESVKTITAHYTAESLIATRDQLAREIEELLTEQLAKYNIEVVSTAIEDMDFTDEFTNAVEAKQVAVQNKLRAVTEQEQKTIEAQQAAERAKIQAQADAEIAQIQAQADMEVAKIGADSSEYQGRKEASIAMQRLASINGWTVVVNENTGVNELFKADGSAVTQEELKAGAEKLMNYYYIQQWDGVLPEYYVSDDNVHSIILGN